MVLIIGDNLDKYPLFFLKLDEESKEVILKNIERKVEIRLPYVLKIDKEFNPNDYMLYILFHNNLPENAILQLFEKDISERIGWIFPINALTSTNHDYKNNIHFLKMAYVSYINLASGNISNLNSSSFIKSPTSQEAVGLIDFFYPQSVVIILHKPVLLKIEDFNFYEYLPSLYKWGYSMMFNPSKELHENKISQFYDEGKKIINKITINKMSCSLKDEGFIKKLFSEWLDSEQHPIMQFYLLYQLIELLINKVSKNEFKKIAINISQEKEDLEELPYKLQTLSRESAKIVILFKQYTQIQSNELKELCIKFLNNPELRNKDLPELLYKVRCFLVHNYRDINKEQLKDITDINFYFEDVVISILNEYKEP